MTVAPFDLGARPRVSAGDARASRALLPVLGALPERWQAEMPPLGTASFAVVGVAARGGGARPIVFAVTGGAGPGRLSVEAGFGARLVDAALGGAGTPRSVRAIGPAERGVLAGLLGGGLEPLGAAIGLGSGPPPTGGAAPISFLVETRAGAGSIALELDGPAPPPRLDGARLRRRAARLPIALRVELAATRLRGVEVAGLAPGDAVVFDGILSQAFGSETPWRVALAVGAGAADGHAAPIQIDVKGKLTVVGGFQARRRELDQEIDMEPTGTSDVTTVLGAAPIEVVAELGRITLRGDELLGLAPGAVLTLPGGRGDVSLRVGGELFAEGEIVDVDGELGVRILRVVAR
jgi:flagellar motor switch protein FliM